MNRDSTPPGVLPALRELTFSWGDMKHTGRQKRQFVIDALKETLSASFTALTIINGSRGYKAGGR